MPRIRSLAVQVSIVVVALSLLSLGTISWAVERSTTTRLIEQLDVDLDTQAREWSQYASLSPARDVAALAAQAQGWLAQQREHPASQVQVFELAGQPLVTNQPGLVRLSQTLETNDATHADDPWLMTTPDGIHTSTIDGQHPLRVLTIPLEVDGKRVGTLRVGDSLTVVERARAALRRQLITIGLPVGLLGALVIGLSVGALLRGLRQVSLVAAAVERGDLHRRAALRTGPDEVRRVAHALDAMLDRLEETIARERRFISDASHELRTPLAVLRAHIGTLQSEAAQLAQRGANIDEQAVQTALTALSSRVTSLSKLVDDLITLAAADEDPGRVLEVHELDVLDIAADLERDLPLYGDGDYSVTGCPGRLVADPHRLEQIFRNLVANAVRHTEDGTITVVFEPAGAGVLAIEVRDTGDGMSQQDVDRAFERFGRGRRADRRRGTGLGLPICEALVSAHGGQITLTSTPGEGTTVRIELPGFTPGSIALTDS